MNKYELAKKITQLEGLTNEEKASLVELLRSQKKYGLVWEDKPEEIETRLVDELPVLTEVPERAIVSESPDAPNHILIEGDNLEALTALAYTHEGKIDVIYIDPPYNTGNKDFVYNDSFVDREDGYRHSKWLSFMNKRLQIAKSLLASGGVIFISIDDNEQAQLKLLCDEIFGAKNFVENIIWQKKFSRSNDASYFSSMHDHILCYIKSTDKKYGWKIGLLNRTEEIPHGYSNPDNDPRGPWTSVILSAKSGSDSLLYEIVTPSGRICTPPSGRYWSCSKNTFEQWNEDNRIWFGKKGNGIPRKKTFLSEVQGGLRPNSILFHTEAGNNQEARQELKEILDGEGKFDGPKPVKLLKLLLKIANSEDATVLDFFAGSGTTLHATMQLNAEDGGHRKCILVTNNENNICEEVTYERNKRVIQGYTTPKGEEVEGLHNNTLRYYRTNFLSRDKSVKNMRQLVRLATDMLCIKNDVYTEAEFCGKKINPNIARYFDNGQGNRMLVIYEERAIQLLVQLMAQTEDDGIKTMVYVFSPGADPYTDDFEDIAERVKLCALPSAIYEAYKRVLPKRKPKFLDEALQEMKAQAEAEANAQQTLDFGENDNMNEEGGEA
ncbi:MAG: site-specific DNA-methyltransferase [Prevotella sp.]|nr:site-specific DNA-methyltransferase [Prevotella sp.]MDY5369201.1 site-specific DNA-methyltransferase [Prevotella sp.]